MSNYSSYSGLAGTILLGSLLGLNYTQYAQRKYPLKDRAGVEDAEFDNSIPHQTRELPGIETVRWFRRFIPEFSPLVLCGALTLLWASRSFVAMNKVLAARYSDIVYQIRRPDVISNRLVALKYLGFGGLVIPVFTGGAGYYIYYADIKPSREVVRESLSHLADESHRIGSLSALRHNRSALSDSVGQFSRTLREGFR